MAYHGRGKNHIQNPYTLPDIYTAYMEDKEEDSPYNIPYSLFVDLITEYLKEISQNILEGGIYMLPYSMGDISVVGKRPKNLNKKTVRPDWGLFNKSGIYSIYMNDHTDYRKYMFRWSKMQAKVKNMKSYRLVFTRENKRKLAAKLKSGDYNYFEI